MHPKDKTTLVGCKNGWSREYQDLVRTLDIRIMKKAVLSNYRGNKSHVDFTKIFVLNVKTMEYY